MADSLYDFLKQCVTEDRLQRFEDVLTHRTRHLTLVLENIHHEHNASACLRTCDCFGIQDVHIVESNNSFSPNREIALGASQWLTIQRYRATESGGQQSAEDDNYSTTRHCLRQLRDAGYRILATSPRQHSVPLHDVKMTQRTAVVFGAEQLGVSDVAVAEADELIHIPMYGFTESFNISVSVALVLQRLVARMRQDGVDWKLAPEETQVLREQWVKQTLGDKLEPLCRRFESDQQTH